MRLGWEGYNDAGTYEHRDDLLLIEDKKTLRAELLKIIEPHGFKRTVFVVAASGFLADSYAIFSPNVISPALAYVYWPLDTLATKAFAINVVTLAGTAIGMVLFGLLADLYGRKKLYGVELVIGIIATIGLTQVSAGYNQRSMNAFSWVIWWRLILGVAIGAEYPLSALIAAEWSATRTRGTMLAAVFLMQPIGQFLAYIVGYGALRSITNDRLPDWTPEEWNNQTTSSIEEGRAAIDAVWRCVIGVGAFPGLLAIVLRWTIPETPRYLVDVKEDGIASIDATLQVFSRNPSKENVSPDRQIYDKRREAGSEPPSAHVDEGIVKVAQSSSVEVELIVPSKRNRANGHFEPEIDQINIQSARGKVMTENGRNEVDQEQRTPDPTTYPNRPGVTDEEEDGRTAQFEKPRTSGFLHYIRKMVEELKGFKRILIAISVCWLIMDVCFYGLGLDTPRTLAMISATRASDVTSNATTNATAVIYDWQAGLAKQDDNIYDALYGDATRALYMISGPAILGSVIFLLFVNRIPRVFFLKCMFLALAFIFAVTGSTLFFVFDTAQHDVTVVFYSLAIFFLNFGPNTVLFMLPAELFPTKYRGTCYGIAAASGKVGAILIQVVVHQVKILTPGSGKNRLAKMLLCFVPLMLFGFFMAWLWIPEVQEVQAMKSQGAEANQKEDFGKHFLLPPRSLEDISENPIEDPKSFGLRNPFRNIRRRGPKSLASAA